MLVRVKGEVGVNKIKYIYAILNGLINAKIRKNKQNKLTIKAHRQSGSTHLAAIVL